MALIVVTSVSGKVNKAIRQSGRKVISLNGTLQIEEGRMDKIPAKYAVLQHRCVEFVFSLSGRIMGNVIQSMNLQFIIDRVKMTMSARSVLEKS